MHQDKRRQQGFSLIEILVIIVVAGFLGALVVNLLGTQTSKSAYPLLTSREAAQAEAAVEAAVANYTSKVNSSTSGVLDDVADDYPSNATVSFSRSTFNSVDTLTITATVGQSSFSTLLTQERTNSSDNPVTY